MNDWALFYANDVLVNNKEHHISLFVKLIHNQIENLNVKYTYCELQEMGDCKIVCVRMNDSLNLFL